MKLFSLKQIILGDRKRISNAVTVLDLRSIKQAIRLRIASDLADLVMYRQTLFMRKLILKQVGRKSAGPPQQGLPSE